MFSECISFPIREEGAPTVVGSGEDADIRLDGDDVLPHHATIVLTSGTVCGDLDSDVP